MISPPLTVSGIQIVHTVEAAQVGGLAATGWTNERRHLSVGKSHEIQILQGLRRAP